jgi:hypothetical protein
VSYTEGHVALLQAAKKLQADWQQVQQAWRDEKCQAFEKAYIMPLQSDLRQAIMAMERMGALIHRARYECAESEGPL